jgi:hypothetical protein
MMLFYCALIRYIGPIIIVMLYWLSVSSEA